MNPKTEQQNIYEIERDHSAKDNCSNNPYLPEYGYDRDRHFYCEGANWANTRAEHKIADLIEALHKIYVIECKEQACSIAARGIAKLAINKFKEKQGEVI